MINLTELTALIDLQERRINKLEIRILELLEQNRQLTAKCKRLDEYDDLVDVNSALVEALKAIEWVGARTRDYCPWCFRWSKDGHTKDCLRQHAIALAEGDKDG